MGSVFAAVQDAANRLSQFVLPLGLSVYGHLVVLLYFYKEIAHLERVGRPSQTVDYPRSLSCTEGKSECIFISSFVSPSNRSFLMKKACGPFSFPIAMPI